MTISPPGFIASDNIAFQCISMSWEEKIGTYFKSNAFSKQVVKHCTDDRYAAGGRGLLLSLGLCLPEIGENLYKMATEEEGEDTRAELVTNFA